MTAKLEFDPETHTYRVDGKRVPGVTTILRHAHLMDLRFADDSAMKRGTDVHTLIEKSIKGGVSGEIKNPLIPYYEAWEKFRRAVNPEILASEEPVFNPTYRYAGMLDLRCQVSRDGGPEEWLVDVKTGGRASWHPLQTAGYALCFDRFIKRYALYLRSDATYSLVAHNDSADQDVFLSALALANWKRNNGVKT